MAEPAEPTLGRVLVGLIPMMLALVSLNAAMLIVAPLWGGIARELGYSEVLAGVITSATPALWMLTAPIAGSVSDRIGRRTPLILGVLCACASQAVFSLALGAGLAGVASDAVVIAGLVGGRALLGVAGGLVTVVGFALAADRSTPAQRTAVTATLGGLVGLGSLGGPALAAAASALGADVVLWVMAALPWVAVPALPFLGPAGVRATSDPGRLPLLDPRVLAISGVVVAGNLALGTADLLLGFLMADLSGGSLEVSGPLAGGALLTAGLGAIVAQLVLSQVRVGPRLPLILGPLLAASAFGIVAIIRSIPVIFACCALAGIGIGLAMAGWFSGMSLSVEDHEQGRVAGRVQALTSLSYVVSPVLAALAYAAWPALPWILLVPTLLGAAVLAATSGAVRRADARALAPAGDADLG